jgi:hypothetical protein
MKNGIAAIGLLAALPACTVEQDQREYWEHPSDAEVTATAFQTCLTGSTGPQSTRYNDWDEAIEACASYAKDIARYCPPAATDCLPQYQRSQADVRRVLEGRK